MRGFRAATHIILTLSALVATGACAQGGGSMGGTSKPAAGDTISLPPAPGKGTISIEESIWWRRSVRSFSDEAPTPEIVSKLLWAAQGITDPVHHRRSAPSAGATYPLEVFLATPEYLARYVPATHSLVVERTEDVRRALAKASFGQMWMARSPLLFVFTAVVARTAARYAERANLYVPIEVGCASENLMLEAAALGWGSVAVGAFADREVGSVLKLPRGWEPLLIVPVGTPAKRMVDD